VDATETTPVTQSNVPPLTRHIEIHASFDIRGHGAGPLPMIFTISLPIQRSLWNDPVTRELA
jgi:hypothetical protein